ncbi:glycosyltransferase family 2 protein [Caldifermentibacillus hisashii]|uniref:glycosyltransferase family 2 protein n=1 Tax=Caldifermentibacillus hisashii TaxID=996558 RepID=UPI002E1D1016|nr:glycosyltransferase family 2 protein [Caldifermentibacillus hisashii]
MAIEISIIIPTFNRPTNLQRAIDSVIKQTFKNWELIIVDDNNPNTQSRFETERLLERYCKLDKRIKYIKHNKNKNGAAARNTGIKLAKGKYIAFLDDDDEYLPNKLKLQYELLENSRNKCYGGVYSGFYIIRNKKIFKVFDEIKTGAFIKETLACEFEMGSGSNLFIRKEIIEELNGFDESFQRHQDYEFLVRFFEKYKLLAIDKPLFNVEQSSNHLNLPDSEKAYEYRMKYINKFKNLLNTMNKSDVLEIYHKNFIDLSQLALKERKYKLAFSWFKKAVSYKYISVKELLRLVILLIYSLLPERIRRKITFVRV